MVLRIALARDEVVAAEEDGVPAPPAPLRRDAEERGEPRSRVRRVLAIRHVAGRQPERLERESIERTDRAADLGSDGTCQTVSHRRLGPELSALVHQQEVSPEGERARRADLRPEPGVEYLPLSLRVQLLPVEPCVLRDARRVEQPLHARLPWTLERERLDLNRRKQVMRSRPVRASAIDAPHGLERAQHESRCTAADDQGKNRPDLVEAVVRAESQVAEHPAPQQQAIAGARVDNRCRPGPNQRLPPPERVRELGIVSIEGDRRLEAEVWRLGGSGAGRAQADGHEESPGHLPDTIDMPGGRRRRGVLWPLLIGILFRPFGGESELRAQGGPTNPDPFARNTVGIEFGAGLLGEAWNLNADREWLIDGTASAWWAFASGRALVVEFHNIRIVQTGSNAFMQGFSPLFRWRMRERGSWRLYAEFGPGISWSDRVTPPRGTKFNYLIQGGFGVQRRLGAATHLLTSFRVLHVSNSGREGRQRNPDIEALGIQTGLMVAF